MNRAAKISPPLTVRTSLLPGSFEVEGALFLQEREIAKDVLLDFVRLRFRINLLQLGDDLRHSVLAVAARNNLQARAIQAQSTFGHEQDTLIVALSHAAPRREPRPAVSLRCHALSLAG